MVEKAALRKHCDFFDRNKDGVLDFWETFGGFRALGFNLLLSVAATAVIHLFFSYPTMDGWFPDPLFSINLKNIQRCRHGSDTQVYDYEGQVDVQRFEKVFSHFSRVKSEHVSFVEGLLMTEAMRETLDFFGWFVSKMEWFFLFLLCAQNGFVSKEDILKQYDGTLFYEIEKRRNRSGMK